MKAAAGISAAVLAAILGIGASGAVLPVAEDSSSSRGRLTKLTSAAGTLLIDATHTGYLYFDLGDLGSTAASQIRSARLRVYFPMVTDAGAGLQVHEVTSAWDEALPSAAPTHTPTPLASIEKKVLLGKRFASVDVTSTVRSWVDGSAVNQGFALVAGAGTKLRVGAKEGSGSGYPAQLEVELNPAPIVPTPIDGTQLAPDLSLRGTTSGSFSGNGAALSQLTAANLVGHITNAQLQNSSVNLSLGPGLAGSAAVGLGGTLSLINTGVLSLRGSGGITVSAANGDITLGTTGAFLPAGTIPWQTITGTSETAQPNLGYFATDSALVTLTLPSSPQRGEIVRITGTGSGGWTIAPAAGQSVEGYPAGKGPAGGKGESASVQYLGGDRWHLFSELPSPAPVNVKSFGALGDGLADDTQAVQAAIDSVLTQGSAEVYFPPGIYRCNLTIGGNARITLTGPKDCGGFDDFASAANFDLPDSAEAVLRPAIATAPLIAIPSPTAPVIRNLRLAGPGAYVSDSIGLQLAADSAGTFNGTGARLSGVAIIDFGIGLLIGTNRVLAEHCNFVGSQINVLSTGVRVPADTLTFIACASGGRKLLDAKTREEPGSRTNFAYQFTGGLKGVNWIGCETGQCGYGLVLDGGFFEVSGSNFEGCDLGTIAVLSGRLAVTACNAFAGSRPFLELRGANATAKVSQTAAFTSDQPFKVWGSTRRLAIDPAAPIEYRTGDGVSKVAVAMSDSTFVGVQRLGGQLIPDGSVITEVLFNARDTEDQVEKSNTLSNYSTSTGRWTCPVDGTYTFTVSLSVSKPGDHCFVYLQEHIGANLVGDFVLAARESTENGPLITASQTRSCFQGRTYSIAINTAQAGPLTVATMNSPFTGKSTTRFQITSTAR